MIWECSERKRKKDKARFLSVLFSDGTSFIECVLPAWCYAKYEALFSEGNYLCLEGECSPDSKNENKLVFWIDAASKLEPINLSYYLRVSDYPEWLGAQKEIEKFTDRMAGRTKRDRKIYGLSHGKSVYLHFRRRLDIVSPQCLS